MHVWLFSSSCGENNCDGLILSSRSVVGVKEGDRRVGVEIYGRVIVTACFCFFDNVAVYGYERMDLLVFHFTVFFRLLQFTSCLKYLFFTMSVWNRLRVVLFIYMGCATRKDSCVTEDEKKERHRFISQCRRNRTHS